MIIQLIGGPNDREILEVDYSLSDHHVIVVPNNEIGDHAEYRVNGQRANFICTSTYKARERARRERGT